MWGAHIVSQLCISFFVWNCGGRSTWGFKDDEDCEHWLQCNEMEIVYRLHTKPTHEMSKRQISRTLYIYIAPDCRFSKKNKLPTTNENGKKQKERTDEENKSCMKNVWTIWTRLYQMLINFSKNVCRLLRSINIWNQIFFFHFCVAKSISNYVTIKLFREARTPGPDPQWRMYNITQP